MPERGATRHCSRRDASTTPIPPPDRHAVYYNTTTRCGGWRRRTNSSSSMDHVLFNWDISSHLGQLNREGKECQNGGTSRCKWSSSMMSDRINNELLPNFIELLQRNDFLIDLGLTYVAVKAQIGILLTTINLLNN